MMRLHPERCYFCRYDLVRISISIESRATQARSIISKPINLGHNLIDRQVTNQEILERRSWDNNYFKYY
jgi:hypothetical protein